LQCLGEFRSTAIGADRGSRQAWWSRWSCAITVDGFSSTSGVLHVLFVGERPLGS